MEILKPRKDQSFVQGHTASKPHHHLNAGSRSLKSSLLLGGDMRVAGRHGRKSLQLLDSIYVRAGKFFL